MCVCVFSPRLGVFAFLLPASSAVESNGIQIHVWRVEAVPTILCRSHFAGRRPPQVMSVKGNRITWLVELGNPPLPDLFESPVFSIGAYGGAPPLPPAGQGGPAEEAAEGSELCQRLRFRSR